MADNFGYDQEEDTEGLSPQEQEARRKKKSLSTALNASAAAPGPGQEPFGPSSDPEEYARNLEASQNQGSSGPAPEQELGSLGAGLKQEAAEKGGYTPDSSAQKQIYDNLNKNIDEFARSSASRSGDYGKLSEQLRQAQEQAKDAYERKANINEWADLAQTLANSLAQYGAAQAGMSNAGRFGSPMSGLPLARVDYDARTARALREQEVAGKSAEEQARLGMEGLRSQEETDKTALASRLHAGTSQARDISSLEEAKARLAEAQQSREDLNRYRQGELGIKEQGLGLRKEKQAQLNPAQIKAEARKEEAISQMPALLDSYINAPEKQKPQVEKSLSGALGKAQVDPQEQQKLLNDLKQASGTGILGTGIGGKSKTEVKQDIIKNFMSALKPKLDGLQSSRAPAAPAAAPTTPAPAAAPAATKKLAPGAVQQYATMHNMDIEKARQYLQSQGFSE